MRKILFCFFLYSFFSLLSAIGQEDIELKLFPEKLEVSQKEPILEFVLSIDNLEKKKVAIRSPEVVNIGMDTSLYCWNLNVIYYGERKSIFQFSEPYWKELQKYCVLKPSQNKCFSFRVNFKKLINSDLTQFTSEDDTVALREILERENCDFGIYEISLEYFDNIQKRNSAVNQKMRSNIIKVNYIEN